MLTTNQINELNTYLQEDILSLKLSGDEIPDRVNFFLENISGVEFLSENEYKNLVDRIINLSV